MRRRAFTGLLVAAALLTTTPAFAHHILGLPHYAYKENYPQAPVLEYPAQSGPYDILLTSYPGRPEIGERAHLVVYIRNRTTGEPYRQPISLRVHEDVPFGQGREILPPTAREHTANQFKYGITFPKAGEYIVELSMDVEGLPEVIPFLMVAGNPRAPITIPLLVGGGLVAFGITIRAIKRKRARRQPANPPPDEPQAA